MRVSAQRRTAALLLGLLFGGGASCVEPPPASDADSSDTKADSGTTTPDSDSDDEDEDEQPDALPPVPILLSPIDGASDQPLELELCWGLVEDPDGEPLRYRVWVDDIELTEGLLGPEDGHAGPCVGPLLFAAEREYG